ncbi:uncharacterized protein LOC122287798 isoform X2 [Carya illinoinensis]|uniref:D-alanine--D-alanine ligase N-terminal domain-containing protein n=2 Tax=Carya illinoinensis TaxID=32201 RepID=A0A922G575_CARIL|nr:uncharacterized protein LOC122287798 isoform X2 [Carya illinoinensis]KAG6734311.1 hypothetical protein I3842_01G266600 [Carya illinoinensis]
MRRVFTPPMLLFLPPPPLFSFPPTQYSISIIGEFGTALPKLCLLSCRRHLTEEPLISLSQFHLLMWGISTGAWTRSYYSMNGSVFFNFFPSRFRHTTEEAIATCIEAIEPARAALTSQLRNTVINDLIEGLTKHDWFTELDIADEPPPVRFSLREWINQAKEVQATVFIAVHGGIGEDGTLQALLEAEGFLIQLLSYKSTVLNGLKQSIYF